MAEQVYEYKKKSVAVFVVLCFGQEMTDHQSLFHDRDKPKMPEKKREISRR
jgi:hypothetical protein